MVSGGDLAGASRLATTPGVLKPTAAGSQIRQLGRGSEGIASLVAHPEHGVAVRKLYDPRGLSSSSMIQRKEEAGRAIGDNPHFARFLGSSQTPHGGGTMHFNEYVPQATPLRKPNPVPTAADMQYRQEVQQAASQTGRDARAALRNVNYEGHDIRKGNMVMDARTGQHRVVDYMPGRRGELVTPDPNRPHKIDVTPAGAHLVNDRQNVSTTKGMLGHMLGGNKPMGVRRNVQVAGYSSLASPASSVAVPLNPPSASSSAATRATKPPKPPTPSVNQSAATNMIKKPKPVPAIDPVQP